MVAYGSEAKMRDDNGASLSAERATRGPARSQIRSTATDRRRRRMREMGEVRGRGAGGGRWVLPKATSTVFKILKVVTFFK
jgi:hypothetical protein